MVLEEAWNLLPVKNNTTRRILEILSSNHGLILLRAPAGSGKTLTSLSYAIASAINGKRMALFFRTISQVDYALKTISSILRDELQAKEKLRIAVVVGKVQYCIKPPRDRAPFPRWCEYSNCELRKVKHGKFSFPDMSSSIRHIKNLCESMRVCPYYLSLMEAPKANLILATQAFFINDNLFDKLGKVDDAIVDEAHGLLFLHFEIDHETYNRGRSLLGKEIGKLSVDDAAVLSVYEDYVRSEGEEVVLKDKRIKILPPIRLVRKRLEKLRKLIMISATIYPTGLFKLIFAKDIDARIEVIPGLIRSTEKRKILGIAIRGLSSKHEQRTQRTYDMYARAIRYLINKYGKPALILTPGYEFGKEIAKRLGVKVVRDPSEVRGDVVISVLRGRMSEGIDVELGEPVKLLVIAGLPYMPRTPEFIAIAKVYSRAYGVNFYELARALEEADMVNAVIQALGRIGRRKKGVGIILDERVKKKKLGISVKIDNI